MIQRGILYEFVAETVEGRVSECVSDQMKLSEQHSGRAVICCCMHYHLTFCELLEELALSGLNSVFY